LTRSPGWTIGFWFSARVSGLLRWELDQRVDVRADRVGGPWGRTLLRVRDDGRGCVDPVDHAGALGDHGLTPEFARDDGPPCRCDQRRGGAESASYRLALHVRAPSGARLASSVLEERESATPRPRPRWLGENGPISVTSSGLVMITSEPVAARRVVARELAAFTSDVGLGDDLGPPPGAPSRTDLLGDLALLDRAVRGLDEAVLVDPRERPTATRSGPMFGPSGVSIGQIGRSASGGRRGPRSPRARGFRPPGPSADQPALVGDPRTAGWSGP